MLKRRTEERANGISIFLTEECIRIVAQCFTYILKTELDLVGLKYGLLRQRRCLPCDPVGRIDRMDGDR